MTRPRPFRLEHPVTPEQQLHESVARWLDLFLLRPATWNTFPAGSIPLPPQYAAKLTRMGLAPGWPDLLIMHARRTYGIELKTVKGRLTHTRIVRTRRGGWREIIGQVEQHERLAEAGVEVAVCRSLPDVAAQLRAWGLPLRAGRIAA